jgi:hypothetical protein
VLESRPRNLGWYIPPIVTSVLVFVDPKLGILLVDAAGSVVCVRIDSRSSCESLPGDDPTQ